MPKRCKPWQKKKLLSVLPRRKHLVLRTKAFCTTVLMIGLFLVAFKKTNFAKKKSWKPVSEITLEISSKTFPFNVSTKFQGNLERQVSTLMHTWKEKIESGFTTI